MITLIFAHSNQYHCWEKSIKGKSINRLPMQAERAHYGVCRKKCFISYVRISQVNSSVSIDGYCLYEIADHNLRTIASPPPIQKAILLIF